MHAERDRLAVELEMMRYSKELVGKGPGADPDNLTNSEKTRVVVHLTAVFGVGHRRQPDGRPGQRHARTGMRHPQGRRPPGHPFRPRRPLPLARMDRDLRKARADTVHERQGPLVCVQLEIAVLVM